MINFNLHLYFDSLGENCVLSLLTNKKQDSDQTSKYYPWLCDHEHCNTAEKSCCSAFAKLFNQNSECCVTLGNGKQLASPILLQLLTLQDSNLRY